MGIIWFCLFLYSSAFGEYRVYELKVVNKKTKQVRFEVSTLDQYQYQGYYYLNRDETIELADTWMCWKRADQFRLHCRRPVVKKDPLKAKTRARLPAGAQLVVE